MNPERYQHIQALLQSALERESDERSSFLDEACAGDDALRRQVESLLVSYEQAGSFLEAPAAEVGASLLTNAPAKLAAGDALGCYRILSQIGAGGMAEVYLAQDTRLGRKIALKLLSASFTNNDDRVRRFRQEASAASALNHPNILTIHEVGQADSAHFIATEFIEGETLRQRLTRAPIPLTEALDIAIQVASALAAAHAAGIVHRDIKPENLMVRKDGYVKVLDFGIAKLTEKTNPAEDNESEAATRIMVHTNPGMIIGTVTYMSPEQARGLEVDLRTDIWSLGVVLYEMVEGRVPFAGLTMSHIIVSILDREPAPLTQHPGSLAGELERVVIKALAKDREERYQTVSEMLLDLRHMKQEMEFEEKLSRSSGAEMIGRSSGQTVLRTSRPAKVSSSKLAAPRSTRKRTTKAIDSLAVLPFINATADPEADYLSDGITESIIDNLAQLSGLRVMARNTVFRYKGREANAQGVGQELNVGAVLLGRVLAFGEQLSIRAELVDVGDGSQLWGELYKCPMADIFDVQEEIAREISEKLRVRLTSEQRKRLGKRQTENTEAYQAYLRGRYFWNKRTGDGLKKSTEYFQQAVDIDPAYAAAYAGLADSYALPGIAEYGLLPPREAMPRARAAASRALEIDNTLAEAQTTLAHVRAFYDWDWQRAEREFKQAIKLDPNYPFAHHWYALYLAAMGRHAEAIAEENRAQEIDPLSLIISKNVGTILYYAGHLDQSIEQYRKALELDPNFARTHVYLGLAYERKGMYEEAIAEYQEALRISGVGTVLSALMGHAHALSGNRSEAIKIIDRLKEESERQYVPAFNIALIYAGLGENDLAFEWLDKAFEERSSWLVSLNVEPMLDSLRSDPRFTALLSRLGLASQVTDRSVAETEVLIKKTVSRNRQAIDSLAVLPFINASADPEAEYLSDGITESIINNLSQLSRLRVMARSTVFRYKGREFDPQEVGQELGVRVVLLGRVVQVRDRLSVHAELVDVADGSQLWGNQYSRDASDIFAIQEDISAEISSELRLKLTGAERERLKKRYTDNTEAFHSYLKGRYYLNKRTAAGLRKAVEHFREAIELDPIYALAYAGLADSYTLLGSAGYDAPSPPEMMSRAKAAAVKALEIDETLAEAHTSLAFIKFRVDWDWTGAEKEFARAIELNPGSATSHHWYALYLTAMGRQAVAISEIKRAQELDPLSLIITSAVGRVYHFAGQYDQALDEYRKALEMDANYGEAHFNLGFTYAKKGMYGEAIAELQDAIKLSENRTVMLAVLGHIYSMAGKPMQARSVLEQLNEVSHRCYVSPLDMAIVYTGLGEKESAFEWFEKAYLERSGALIYLKVEPLYDSLRAEPRFNDLLRRMNLAP